MIVIGKNRNGDEVVVVLSKVTTFEWLSSRNALVINLEGGGVVNVQDARARTMFDQLKLSMGAEPVAVSEERATPARALEVLDPTGTGAPPSMPPGLTHLANPVVAAANGASSESAGSL
jgi:hypothetical protein